MMLMLGIWDDLRGVRARTKLFVQAGAALVAYACMFRIDVVRLIRGRGAEIPDDVVPARVLPAVRAASESGDLVTVVCQRRGERATHESACPGDRDPHRGSLR